MKPTYENSGDEVNERQLASLLENKWQCKMQRQMKYAQFDYVALRGKKIQAFVEMRHRGVEHNKYPTCFISLTKLLRANELKQTTGLPCFFVVSWLDRSGWINLDQIFKLKRSGKKWSRRNNPEISELLGSIPIDKFKMFN